MCEQSTALEIKYKNILVCAPGNQTPILVAQNFFLVVQGVWTLASSSPEVFFSRVLKIFPNVFSILHGRDNLKSKKGNISFQPAGCSYPSLRLDPF